jgi:TRAP-type C4-dicarboxylate transport system substrate-binding protein
MDEQRRRPRMEVLLKALDRALSIFACLIYGVLTAIAFSQVIFREVGKYLTMTQHQYTGSHIIMGEPAFQQALLKAGLENAKYQQEIALEQNREFLKNLKDFGVQIFEINIADLQKVVAPVYDDFTKSVGGKDWAKQVLAVK